MILQSGKSTSRFRKLYSAIKRRWEMFWLSIPVNHILRKSNMVNFFICVLSHRWSLTSSPPPPPPPLLLYRRISNSWLSTGWFTMTIALELCDRIDVYGMVAPDFCRWDAGAACKASPAHHHSEPLKQSRVCSRIEVLEMQSSISTRFKIYSGNW